MSVEVEVGGIRLRGRHGVHERERAEEQWYAVDVRLDMGDPPATDRIEEAVDYREIAECVRAVVERGKYHLLETLAAALADALLGQFPAARRASVRIAKPEIALAGGGVPRVSVERRRAGAS